MNFAGTACSGHGAAGVEVHLRVQMPAAVGFGVRESRGVPADPGLSVGSDGIVRLLL